MRRWAAGLVDWAYGVAWWLRAFVRAGTPDAFLEAGPDAAHHTPLVLLPGIWERWRDPTGRWQRSYAIVTVPPDPIVAGIHDRMPLVLPRAARAAWLDPSLTEPDAVRALLAPGPLVGWTVRAVSPRVGKPEHDDPACLDAPTEAELAPALPPARRPAGRARKPPSGQGSLF